MRCGCGVTVWPFVPGVRTYPYVTELPLMGRFVGGLMFV